MSAEKKLEILLSDIRYFEHYPEQASCFLCGTNRDEPCTLIGIDGTRKDSIEEANPVHLKCLLQRDFWRINMPMGVIYAYRAKK
jgi:hypothetical protein